MVTLIAIAGSLRQHSLNLSLLKAAQALAPPDCRIDIEPIRDIPLYDGDVEQAQGVPPAVTRLKDRIAGADGLLIASPEYNNSVPGVLKNAIDWLSRPPADSVRVFRDRPVAIMGATPGGMGTALAQTALLPVLRTLGTRPWFGRTLYVSRAHEAFDKNGVLTDAGVRERLGEFIGAYASHAASLRS